MYNISDNFIEQIGLAGKEKDIRIINNNKEIVPQSYKHSFSSNIFTSVMQKIEFEVKNGNVLLENAILEPKYGLKINNEFEYINYSNYNVYSSEINYDTNIVKTIAYDHMIKFMISYELDKLNITFPITILQLITKICNYIGVELYSTDFFNANLSIEEDLFTALNCTYRDIIDYICQATLTTAIIKDNKLYFKSTTETNKTITPQILKKFKIKQQFGGCNSLVLGRGDLNDNIYSKDNILIEQDGLQEIRFDNNEILNKRREKVIDNMFNQIKGLKYYSFETKDLGIGIFEPADFCNMEDLNGNTYKVLILNQSITITSGCEGAMSANVPSTSTTQYQYATDSQKRQTKTEIIVDKQNKKITQLTQETTENTENITKQEQTIEGIKTNVSSVETKVETVEGTATKALSDASKAQTTANTANTNAQNAQKTADNNTTAITTTNKKVAEIETSVKGISATVSSHTESIEQVQEQTKLNTDEIARLGSTETVEDKEITVDASNNPAKLYCYGNTEQKTSTASRNICPNEWELGHYTTTGVKQEYENRIRVPYLVPCKPNTTYWVNMFTQDYDIKFILRGYNSSKGFIRNYSAINNATTFTTQADEYYLGITLYDVKSTTSDILNLVETGTIKPFICLNSETDKTYTEFIPDSPSPDYPSRIRNVGDNIQLFDKTTITSGYRLSVNGQPNVSAEINYTSDFIPVAGNTTYIRTNTVDAYTRWCFYDSSKAFISKDDANQIITTPSNARYIRFSEYLSRIDTMKLEKGSIPTPYTPYNCGSAGFKVENKNLFDKDNANVLNDYYINSTGDVGSTTGSNQKILYITVKPNTTYTISKIISNRFRIFTHTGKLYGEKMTNFKISDNATSLSISTGNDKTLYIMYMANDSNEQEILDSIQVEEGNVATEYVEHQEQTVIFPFAEGQLLHKGDYLAKDGIHQKRNTLVLKGTEDIGKSSNYIGSFYVRNFLKATKNYANILCNYATRANINKISDISTNYKYGTIFIENANGLVNLWITQENLTIDDFKSFLAEQYANGTPVTIEYELAEEEIIPYTPEQQKVLDSIETFKGINHIYCIDEIEPEKIVLTYYPNTPYNDTLVNKDTFDKVTTDMNAEFNIRANEVETSVREQTTASILTLLNNNYLSAEQVNALVQGNADDILAVQQQLKQTVTSSQMQIEITKAIEGGVSYLKNTLFTIDENGMTIATNQDEFNAKYNNKGMYLYSYDELIANFDVNGTTIRGNLNVNGELITPNLRMMNTNVDGVPHTHIHWIGG